ncbi:hypothetical protein IP90_00855 [Luteimonas cucumeris]|uniref:Uncharacterized protein n=1 Tax=Luteimonas cucumeris TaxID=985012 RepID=A0A562LAQ8_9GAMM|nr:hypothetical protein [Luteimonas cucumeris]TWI04720.1 hypothetical protein IP90_00855 [Luteimonas cucumeris]
MKRSSLALTLALAVAAGAAQAAGPLYLSTETGRLRPLVWDTSNGPIPVYTDGGGAFTYDYDGVTPFITIERANEITAFAFNEWSEVPTSTFKAAVAGTIASQTGVADVTSANAADFYGVENGYGFWVLYDTDGSILEEYFGVPRSSVLGIAFPEFGDGNGRIIEATAVMNGWNVWDTDVDGNQVAGVFTHEFGHAINLSHSQVNGPMVYQSYTYAPYQPGIKGCVAPVHRYDYPDGMGANPADPKTLETMFPFIDHGGQAGAEQSTIDHPDDKAGISNLYPAANYASSRGTISGVLRLKDGSTEYSGINIVARNVDDLMGDAVSAMSGDQTQGLVGPDGRFTINNLTPGEQYVVYIEEITSGGYPTTPTMMVSQGEYWNAAEDSDPVADTACDATPILAEAGVSKQADITYNGYLKGVQFTPVVSANLVQVSKSGRRASGTLGTEIGFFWDQNKGIELLPEGVVVSHGAMDRNGQRTLVSADPDGNGIREPVILGNNQLTGLGDLSGDSCNVDGISASGWDIDDSANKAVGLAYVDRDGDGRCGGSFKNEIVPFVWDAKRGMRQLDLSLDEVQPWVRAAGISGNGRVIVGSANISKALAWVDEGKIIDLGQLIGANDLYATNYDGTRVPMYSSIRREMVLWNAMRGTGEDAFTSIDGLRYCRDVPYTSFFGEDLCAVYGEEYLYEMLGTAPMGVSAVTDKGDIVLGRAGSFFTGFSGGIWIEGLGWMSMREFLRKQGVVEAENIDFNNPLAVSASGSEIVGGIAGAQFSWMIQADQVYVCQNGQSVLTGFPNGLKAKVAAGAQFGRCEFQ